MMYDVLGITVVDIMDLDYFQELIEKQEKFDWIVSPESSSYSASSEDNLESHQAKEHVFNSVFGFIQEDLKTESLKSSDAEPKPKIVVKQERKELCAKNLRTAKKKVKAKSIQERRYKCEDCDFSTNQKHNLKDHVAALHEGIVLYRCSVCSDYKTYHKKSVESHIKNNHKDSRATIIKTELREKRKYNCEECEYSTDLLQLLKGHRDRKHNKLVRFQCSLCDYKNYSQGNTKVHINKNHNGMNANVLKIDYKKYKGDETSGYYKKRERIQNLNGLFRCSECDYTSHNENQLRDHRRSIHQKVLRFYCSECNLKSYHKISIKNHIGSHTDIKAKILKISCQKCLNGINHKDHDGMKAKEDKYQCEECEYSTNWKHLLTNHKSTIHLGVVRFMCSICRYRTFYKHSVERHINGNHQGENPNVLNVGCLKCQSGSGEPHEQHEQVSKNASKTKTFHHAPKVSKNASKTKTSHHAPKVFKKASNIKCTECDSMFRTNKLRVDHFKENHPGKNIYQCNQCDYGSNYLANLTSHVNSLHEMKSLDCDRCDFTSTWNQYFHKHIREKHGIHQKNSKHSSDVPLLCDYCVFTTVSKVKLVLHNSRVHNRK